MKRITWINLILGLWLIIAPFALKYAGLAHPAAVEDVVMGIIVAAFSWWMLASALPMMGQAWFEMLCGIWVAIAPFVIGYSGLAVARTNDVWVGIVVLVVAIVAAIGIGQTSTRRTIA
jgi:SPW repeat